MTLCLKGQKMWLISVVSEVWEAFMIARRGGILFAERSRFNRGKLCRWNCQKFCSGLLRTYVTMKRENNYWVKYKPTGCCRLKKVPQVAEIWLEPTVAVFSWQIKWIKCHCVQLWIESDENSLSLKITNKPTSISIKIPMFTKFGESEDFPEQSIMNASSNIINASRQIVFTRWCNLNER